MRGNKKQSSIVISDAQVRGINALLRFRIMSIDQFARAAGIKKAGAGKALRNLAQRKLLKAGGHTPLPGAGRSPRIYWVTKKGFDYFREHESLENGEGINFDGVTFTQINLKTSWPRSMPHRLATVDAVMGVIFALGGIGCQVKGYKFDYNKERRFGKDGRRATTDFVSDSYTEENKLVPDAVLCAETAGGDRVILFIEADRGTEDIAVGNYDPERTIEGKMQKYDRYFNSGRFHDTYKEWSSDFKGCLCLFVTTSTARVARIREKIKYCDTKLNDAFLFSTYEYLLNNPTGKVWVNRKNGDNTPRFVNGRDK